tara:strand:- start:208 stop:672 length:465 start_codon:yes stop_codon:yes gene_type:complete
MPYKTIEVVYKGTKKNIKVDTFSYDCLLQHKWYILNCRGNLYAATNIKSKCVLMHRFLKNINNEYVVHHKNLNTLDNRLFNLEICENNAENLRKGKLKYKNNSSGYTCLYHETKRDRWIATFTENGKRKTKSFSCKKHSNAKELAIAILKSKKK